MAIVRPDIPTSLITLNVLLHLVGDRTSGEGGSETSRESVVEGHPTGHQSADETVLAPGATTAT